MTTEGRQHTQELPRTMKTLSGEWITRTDPHRHKFASALAEYLATQDEESDTSEAARMMNVDDRVVNEVCDNCGSALVVVRSRAGRFCTSECAEAFELS